MSKKILFISYFYPPVGGKGLPGVQRTVKFLRKLVDWQLFVLTLDSDQYPPYFTLNNNLALPISTEEIHRTGKMDFFGLLIKCKETTQRIINKFKKKKNESKVNRVRSNNPEQSTETISNYGIKDVVSEILTYPDFAYPWIIPAVLKGRRLVKKNKIDVIFATGMPWSSLIIGWLIKKTTKAKLVIDFRDPWVNNPYNTPNKSTLLRKWDNFFEKRLVRDADLVSLNTEELCRVFQNRYSNQPNDKFICLPNGYDPGDFQHMQPSQETEIEPGKLILSHAGFLYGYRDPKPIFQALQLLQGKNEIDAQKIVFQQIGEINLHYGLENYLKTNELQDSYINRGSIDYDQCLEEMQQSDILVIIQQDTLIQVPSKLYEYIYLEKPILILASIESALGSLAREYGFGEIFEPTDVDGISEYLQRKFVEKESQGHLTASYENKTLFDVQHIATKLESHLKEII